MTDDEMNAAIARGKPYVLVHLLRGPARDLDEAAAERLQLEHLRYLFARMEAGELLINGPVLGDGELRGISIYAGGDVEAARALAEADPAVKAGRLRVEVFPWFGLPGSALR